MILITNLFHSDRFALSDFRDLFIYHLFKRKFQDFRDLFIYPIIKEKFQMRDSFHQINSFF